MPGLFCRWGSYRQGRKDTSPNYVIKKGDGSTFDRKKPGCVALHLIVMTPSNSLPTSFNIEPLDTAKHRREDFDCGVLALNEFLKTRARKEMDSGVSVCFVLISDDRPQHILGYYTLSAASLLSEALPEVIRKKLPRYPAMPATLLGRLARSLEGRGQRLGDRLMISALTRARAGAEQVGSWAVITDPKDDRARRFYEAFGFKPLTADRLFLPMKDITAL